MVLPVDDAEKSAEAQEEVEDESAEDETPEDEEVEPTDDNAEERPSARQSSSRKTQTPTVSKSEAKTIRRWAQENGYKTSPRGRLSKTVVEAYRNATE